MQKRKNILDAGCGIGRDLLKFYKASSSAKIIGVDFSDSVSKAYENTKKFKNAVIAQSDLNKLPFYFNFFDFILAEGVLHHTVNPKKSFVNLVKYLKKNGEIAIYVYNKKPLIREFCDNFLRKYTVKMLSEKCWKFSRNITKLGKSLSRIKQDLILDSDIDLLNIKKGRYNLQKFFYDYILKCFWNDAFSFDENVLVNFDWYHPKLANKHTKSEIKSWFNKNKLRLKWIYEDKSGIAARGIKI